MRELVGELGGKHCNAMPQLLIIAFGGAVFIVFFVRRNDLGGT